MYGKAWTMQPVSKLTAKGQTTIPREVRERLSLGPGDLLTYEIDDDAVRLRKVLPMDVAYLRAVQATLSEWESPEDAEAYDDL
jgi:AbrB family looped-hinge helix DNA binding protein